MRYIKPFICATLLAIVPIHFANAADTSECTKGRMELLLMNKTSQTLHYSITRLYNNFIKDKSTEGTISPYMAEGLNICRTTEHDNIAPTIEITVADQPKTFVFMGHVTFNLEDKFMLWENVVENKTLYNIGEDSLVRQHEAIVSIFDKKS